MSVTEVDIQRLFENVGRFEPPFHRSDVVYAPRSFFTGDGSSIPRRITVSPGDQWRSADLNPAIVSDQGIESTLDSTAGNVIYTVDGGTIRIGFYDRTDIDSVPEPTNKGELRNLDRLLIDGTDPHLPKLEIVETQPFPKTMIGESFPHMFSYRSVVFGRDTPFGIMVDVDNSIAGTSQTFKDLKLDEAFVYAHPDVLNLLYQAILEEAKKRGIADELSLNKMVIDAQRDALRTGSNPNSYIIKYLMSATQGWDVSVSYTQVPVVSACARVNGAPMASAKVMTGGSLGTPVYLELFNSGRPVDDSQMVTLGNVMIQDPKDPAASKSGDLVYRVIPREESAAEAAANPCYGLIEVQVSLGYTAENLEIKFTKPEISEVPEILDLQTRGEEIFSSPLRSSGRRDFTAGRVGVENVRSATVNTTQYGFSRVLLRDVFCLVHEETGQPGIAYGVAKQEPGN